MKRDLNHTSYINSKRMEPGPYETNSTGAMAIDLLNAGAELASQSGLAGLHKQAEKDKTKTIHPATLDKIERLKAYRREGTGPYKNLPSRIDACAAIGIDPKTVRTHEPELWRRWEDTEFP